MRVVAAMVALCVAAVGCSQQTERPAARLEQSGASQSQGPGQSGALRSPGVGLVRVAFEIGQHGRAWGTIVFELDEARAPVTVGNFLRYVDEGYYDGTIIQRVLVGKDARINIFQGGGYADQGRAYAAEDKPKAGQHGPIKLESQGGLKNERGTIAMARDSDPDTATSEFFVNVEDNPKLNYASPEKPGYAAFGRIVSGWDVVERVKKLEVTMHPDPVLKGEKSLVVDPPVVKRARRVGAGE